MSLSVCMIVKDAEKSLGKALDSVMVIADEAIVVDTGSSDKTKEAAQERGAQVFDFAWKDDFSAARNESLRHATKEWVLVLDADEELPKKYHGALKTLVESGKADAYRLLFINLTNDSSIEGWKPIQDAPEGSAKGFFASRVVRLFRNDERYRFQGIVHEVIEPSIKRAGGKVGSANVAITNHGNLEEGALQAKRKKYLAMAERKAKETGSAEAHFEKGVLQKQLGKTDEALISFEEAVKKSPKHHLAQFELGVLLEKKQDFEKALKAYEESALSQGTSGAFVGMARCQIKTGKMKDAFRNLKKASLINPNNHSIYFNMGVVHDLSGNFKEAVKMYNLCIKLNPGDASAFLNMGNTLVNLRQYDSALKAYERAATLGHKRQGEIEARIKEMKEKLQNTAKVSYSVQMGEDKSKEKASSGKPSQKKD